MSLHNFSDEMTPFFERIWNHQKVSSGKLALPESLDVRVLSAAEYLLANGKLSELWLFSEKSKTLSRASQSNIHLEEFQSKIVWSHEAFPGIDKDLTKFSVKRLEEKGKAINEERIKKQSQSSIFQAGFLLQQGHVDAVIAGAETATSEVLRAVLGTSGLQAGCDVLSGSMMMEHVQKNQLKLFADIAVVPEPSQKQIMSIAKSSAETWSALVPDAPPRIAFLSFSTNGSAKSPSSEKMQQAACEFKAKYPDIIAEGEIQFDAAVSDEIRKRKFPNSALTESANIFIFPNLDAGNISYKIAQRLGGYNAVGPLLQGTQKPFFDLSRGTSAEDIVKTSAIALCMS